jgi:hypothetical protein
MLIATPPAAAGIPERLNGSPEPYQSDPGSLYPWLVTRGDALAPAVMPAPLIPAWNAVGRLRGS